MSAAWLVRRRFPCDGAAPTDLVEVHTMVFVKANPFSFQQLALDGAVVPARTAADPPLVIDDSMPGYVTIKGQSSHRIPYEAGRTPAHNCCNLAVASHLTGRNLTNNSVDPPEQLALIW